MGMDDRTYGAGTDDELFARVLDTLAVGVHVFDAEGVYRLTNPAAERMTGVPGHALIGRRYDDPPFTRRTLDGRPFPPSEHPFAVVRRTGRPIQDSVFTIVRGDGSEVVISVSAAPHWSADGRFIGVVASYQDLTVHVQAVRERDRLQALTDAALAHLDLDALLHELLDRMRSLLAVDTAAALLFDADGASLRVRAAAGLDEEMARGVQIPVGAGFAGRIAATRRPVVLDRVDETTVLNPVLRARGVRSLLGVPLLVGGRVTGVLHVGTLAPRQFTDDDTRLLQLVADRAALAIEHARLYDTERAARLDAEAATRARDEFLSLVSHELRTPLTSLLGWLQILRARPPAPERLSQALDVMDRSTRTLKQLVEDLLDIARITTGRLVLDVGLLALGPLIEAACQSMQAAADAKEIRLETRLDQGVGPVRGDETRLLQALWNLLNNAVKFTPAGGRITIRLSCEEDHAVIRVVDTGIGIAPDLLAAIFDPFRQAEGVSARVYGGLGLGLALVRHIVELHGGTVEAASEGAARGATFTVRLPVVCLAPEPFAEPVRGTGGEVAAADLSLAGIAVLILDDDADTREVLGALLDMAGARVMTAASSGEALEVLETEQIDVVVADLAMPGEDGFAFISRMREQLATRRAPVPAIALTAFSEQQVRRLALSAGFRQYLAKPVDAAALFRTIREVAEDSSPAPSRS